MDEQNLNETPAPDDRDIKAAQELCREAARDIWEMRRRVKAGEFEAAGEAGAIVRSLKQAYELLQFERAHLEKLCRTAGARGGAELDLAGARAEIGRRLAQLRRARGG